MVEAVVTCCLGIAEYLVAPIGRQLTYLFCFNSNIKELEAKFDEFQTTRQGVQMWVDRDERNVRVIAPNVKDWLKRANDVTNEVQGIIQEKPSVKEGCLNGLCPNLKLRYSLSRKAVKKTEVVVKLQAAGVCYTQTSYSPPPTSLETIPNGDFTGFESRMLTMEKIIKALKHDEIKLIGICGMGGTGKTTMVKEVAKRAKEEALFDEVAMVVVGQEVDPNTVQACIAEMLGFKDLRDTKSPIVRADLLRKRLLQDDKKILVILDDIWAAMELEDMGFPLRGAYKNFKMIYTSRTQFLWHDLQVKEEIPLELLLEDEAWQLFREKVGDLADARDLQPIAKKIANQCRRLPLALVLVGGALPKKSGRNAIKEMWEGILDRLTCASNTPANIQLSSRLELSYEYLEDEKAKRLFLLCCLFKEDEDIRIEDLARYGFGLSLFDRTYEMGKVRRQVLLIVNDLKNRYLLSDNDNKNEECVKVHDLVREMGISIASKVKWGLVSHGAVSEWPKMVTHEPYIAISVISGKIKGLHEGLTYPNLEFLMLRCQEIEKFSPNFFEGMGKLKVLELKNFHGILTFEPLKNLTTLALEGFCGMLDNVRVIGDLVNLEILSFRNSKIKELTEEIGDLVNLRLLDLSRTDSLERIPSGVISRLLRLEELYVMHSRFCDWEGEGQEKGGNANLKEFEFLFYLNTLEIMIKNHVVVPKLPILGELKKYKVIQEDLFGNIREEPYEKKLIVKESNWDTPAGRGGINTLLRNCDCLVLCKGSNYPVSLQLLQEWNWAPINTLSRNSDSLILDEGSNDLGQLPLQDVVGSLQQLKYLEITSCYTLEYLANTMNPIQQPPNATAVFPILEQLLLRGLHNLREICSGPVPAASFGQLNAIDICGCRRLGNLFQQPIVGCLTQLKHLSIVDCHEVEEVISKEQREDVHVAPNRIEFLKLEFLRLRDLPSLVGFCRGIDQIDLPELKNLQLHGLGKVNRLFHDNNNRSSNSEQNNNISSFHSLFPHKASLPNLEVLQVSKLENLERLGHGPLSVASLFKLTDFSIKDCDLLEVVFESEGDSNEPNPEILHSTVRLLLLNNLPKLIYISKRDPMIFKYIQTLDIRHCDSLRYVFAPTMTKSIPQLRELKIWRCKMMSRIVAEENGLGESSVDEVEFPQLERLELRDLPNLRRFYHSTHPLQLPLLSKMVISKCPSMDAFSLGHVSTPNLSLSGIPWNGDVNNAIQLLQKEQKKEEEEERRKREEERRNWEDRWRMWEEKRIIMEEEEERRMEADMDEDKENRDDKSRSWQVGETQCQLVAMPERIDGTHKVAQLLYTNSGNGVLALGCNGSMRLWKWGSSKHNPSGKWQPASGLAMKNDETGAKLEAAVPCIALSKNGAYVISACGGMMSLFNMLTFKVMTKFMPPPPASTFLAFFPRDSNLIAIGREDSTIRIYNVRLYEVKSTLKGHQKRITGLAFSTILKLLVSSGADAQLCFWSMDTWEKLKSVPIQLPAGTCDCDTRVQFHSGQIHLLVSHETQLAIYDASKMDRIRQWVPQDVLHAPISFAAYSCNNQIVYTSFCDGNIGVFDADSLTLRCRIAPSAYLSSALLSGSQDVYPSVIAAHPQKPGQFAIGLTEGSVIVMERPTIRRVNGMLNGRTATSSNTSNHKPDQKREKEYWSLDYDSYSEEDDGDGAEEDDGDGDDGMSKVKELQNEVDPMSITLDDITDKITLWPLTEIVDPTQCRLVAMPDSTNEAHKVAQVLYTNSGDGVLALHCNGIMRLWKWCVNQHNRSGMATASVVPQQWQPASGLAMKNDLTGAKLEEVVPCMALTGFDRVISACGGVISKFDIMTFKVVYTYMTFSLASTFLAVYPKDNFVKAIGMEDSTIYIFYGRVCQVQYILKGHQKRITGLAFSVNLKILVSSGDDAQLCTWSLKTWDNLKSVPIQLPSGKPCNGDTRVQFHSDQIRLLVSHETQLAIYDASKMDRIRQWVPQDVLPAPISCATYSCDSQFIYASFCDGNIGVFNADSLMIQCRIVPSAYLSPALSSGSQAVYPLDIAAHPHLPNQFAIGLTDGSVIVMEPPKKTGLDGGIASSSNASNQTPDQGKDVDVDEDLDEDVDEDALITTRTRTSTATTGMREEEDLEEGEIMDVDEDLDEDVDEDALITTRTRTRTATTGTHDDEEDLEEKRKKEEEKEKKGKAPLSG